MRRANRIGNYASIALCATAFAAGNSQEALAHDSILSHAETLAAQTDSLRAVLGAVGLRNTLVHPALTETRGETALPGGAPAAASDSPYPPSLETMPLTIEMVEEFMPVIKAETPNSPCNSPKDGKSHGYDISILPASDNDTDSTNDMTTTLPDGSVRVVIARARGKCRMDYLNFTPTGAYGRKIRCTVDAHEGEHLDTSLSPWGYLAPEEERDPTGKDLWHAYKTPELLMYGRYLTQSYPPCQDTAAEYELPAAKPGTPALPTVYSHGKPKKEPYSTYGLAMMATNYIPRLKGREDVGCQYYRPNLKAPALSRRLCYSGKGFRTAANGAIVTIKSLFTIEDGTPDGRPDFKSDKISNRALRRYLAHGPLTSRAGKRAYLAEKNTKPGHTAGRRLASQQ